MTLQTLEYFIAVSRHRNFTKAAEACHVTQPALSRAIRGLEEELGCSLLIRSGRTAVLTPEGEVCLAEAERVLRQCEELKLRVREAGRENQRPLRVGYLQYSYLNYLMQNLTRLMPEGIPFPLETMYGDTPEIKRQFAEGKLDAMLLPDPCMEDLKDIGAMSILRGHAYALVYKTHPFYERETVTVAELKDQPLILWDDRMRLLNERYIRMFREAGFEPKIVARGGKIADVVALATIHNAIAFAVTTSSKANIGECRAIPIIDSPLEFGLMFVWHKGDKQPQLAAMRTILSPIEGIEEKYK